MLMYILGKQRSKNTFFLNCKLFTFQMDASWALLLEKFYRTDEMALQRRILPYSQRLLILLVSISTSFLEEAAATCCLSCSTLASMKNSMSQSLHHLCLSLHLFVTKSALSSSTFLVDVTLDVIAAKLLNPFKTGYLISFCSFSHPIHYLPISWEVSCFP